MIIARFGVESADVALSDRLPSPSVRSNLRSFCATRYLFTPWCPR